MNLYLVLSSYYTDYTWSFDGEEIYTNLTWQNSNDIEKPSESELQSRWNEMSSEVDDRTQEAKLNLLRSTRNSLLKLHDWVVIKHYSMGLPVPENWATYLQALRDLPATQLSNVTIDSNLLEITNLEQIFPIDPNGEQFAIV